VIPCTYVPKNLVNDIVGLVLLAHCFAVNPSPTRYSRSVLINRLFMFNAAWYSDPKVFEALRRKARLRRESVGGDTGTSNKGMLLHRGNA